MTVTDASLPRGRRDSRGGRCVHTCRRSRWFTGHHRTMYGSSALASTQVPIPDCHTKVLPEEPCLNTLTMPGATNMRSRFAGLWQHPDFLKLWVGQTISQFGSHIGGGALRFTAILILGATPLQLSLLSAAQLAPMLLLGLIAGVWVDRLRR